MESIKKKLANLLVKVAENGLEDDFYSTGCTWIYQPKLPKLSKGVNEVKDDLSKEHKNSK